MPKFVVSDARLLATANLFTSNEQARFYLHGVYIQPAEGGGVLLTATDGHALFHAHDPDGAAPDGAAIVKIAEAPAAWADGRHVLIDTDAGVGRHGKGGPVGVSVVDGIFPDYARIIPRETSGEVATFAAAQLAGLVKAEHTLGGTASRRGGAFRVLHNGNGPALVTFSAHARCFAVAMPLRASGAPDAIPDLPKAVRP